MSESFQSSVCVPLLAGLLVALLSFGSVPAHAQVDSWGVTAGVTSMTGSGDGLLDDGLGRNTGILVGGSVQVGVAGRVSLRPELTYVQKGWTTNFRSAQGEKIRTTVALDYLELPVIADVRLVSVREVSVHAVAGPTVGVRVRSEAAGEGGDVSTLSEFGDRIDRTEVGLAAGGGVQGTVGGQVLRLDVRYRWSLLNINDRRVQTPGGLSDSSPFIRNQGGGCDWDRILVSIQRRAKCVRKRRSESRLSSPIASPLEDERIFIRRRGEGFAGTWRLSVVR